MSNFGLSVACVQSTTARTSRSAIGREQFEDPSEERSLRLDDYNDKHNCKFSPKQTERKVAAAESQADPEVASQTLLDRINCQEAI